MRYGGVFGWLGNVMDNQELSIKNDRDINHIFILITLKKKVRS
jgi:hypothetical protein